MNDWFIWLLFGHFFGDYIFQSRWMAVNKKDDILICIVHCLVYTFVVSLFLQFGAEINVTFMMFILIFASHIVLDGTTLVEWWCNKYGVRSWDTDLPKKYDNTILFQEPANITHVVTCSFGALVYAVIDNTLHLFMMLLIIRYLL